ncbi:ATP/GTP-binding protein, partial [Streptomyces venezuelae]
MDSATSDPTASGSTTTSGRTPLTDAAETGLKIVVVGGFGVGKTTLVRSVSEIRPLNTEEV